MTQQQSSLQEALNRLLKGDHQVLLNPALTAAVAQTVSRLISNQKEQIADKLLEQIALATRSVDKNISGASSSCLVATAEKLSLAEQWGRLDRIVPALQALSGSQEFSEQVRAEADKVLRLAKSRQSVIPPAESSGDAQKNDSLTLREEQIFQLAGQGNTEAAKTQLFELVVACAQKKDFHNAERLRERMYEIDPMALMEIIQTGDIIEQEKKGAISKDHVEIWANLRQVLSSEEFNALYHEMGERTYKPEEIIAAQGAKNDELFFINHGSVRVTYSGGEKELFFKNMGKGEIVGENFFNPSVWTVSLTAQQQTSISVLKLESLARLEQKLPGIESKLIDYYSRSSDIYAEMKKKGMDRRVHERYRKECKIQLQIVDDKEKVLSTFRGDMTDISLGGLSFNVRITNKENIRLLLGRHIKVIIPVTNLPDAVLRGLVIGVQVCDLVLSDYSVHVKFNAELERNQLKSLVD
ncbi:MAG: cyclic nucleotide-binding domain-containing protein [Thermodesulfobacteriota bacterium]